MSTSLIHDIIKAPGINFRGINLGDPISSVETKEGPYAEKKLYSNPFLKYFFEIGEMEEISLYYNFEEADEKVKWITLQFIHYPDHYWTKEGNTNISSFWMLFEKNELHAYSQVFTDTVSDVVKHFTAAFNKEPALEKDDSIFDQAQHNYNCYTWDIENELRLSVLIYADNSDTRTVKNTMKISLRPF